MAGKCKAGECERVILLDKIQALSKQKPNTATFMEKFDAAMELLKAEGFEPDVKLQTIVELVLIAADKAAD